MERHTIEYSDILAHKILLFIFRRKKKNKIKEQQNESHENFTMNEEKHFWRKNEKKTDEKKHKK